MKLSLFGPVYVITKFSPEKGQKTAGPGQFGEQAYREGNREEWEGGLQLNY